MRLGLRVLQAYGRDPIPPCGDPKVGEGQPDSRGVKWPVAVVLSYKDPVEPTKVLIDFAKKNPELEIKIGVLDGKLLTKADLTVLAELPSREVLLGKLVSVMAAVPTSLVTVLSGVPRNFVQVLNAYCDQKKSLN